MVITTAYRKTHTTTWYVLFNITCQPHFHLTTSSTAVRGHISRESGFKCQYSYIIHPRQHFTNRKSIYAQPNRTLLILAGRRKFCRYYIHQALTRWRCWSQFLTTVQYFSCPESSVVLGGECRSASAALLVSLRAYTTTFCLPEFQLAEC